MKTAPLVIFVYNRLYQTQKMLEAINRNFLTEVTDVFIYSDGPKNDQDRKKVSDVRSYIHHFEKNNKFKSVIIKEAGENKGLANSIIDGASEVIKKYGKIIVLEDDLITAENFLQFMNDCLWFYEHNKKVWSIGGTSYELPSLKNYPYDVFACYRGESCGWGTWLDRWEKVDWTVSDYRLFLRDRKRKKMFRRGGQDMVEALKRQMEGKTDSWAIRWCYQESKENMFTIMPVVSLITNIGWDGSGTHSDVDHFHVKIGEKKFEYELCDVQIDERLMKDYRKYFSRPLINRVLDYVYLRLWRRQNA